MRVVLFHPRGYEWKPRGRAIQTIACVMPPVGLASIAAVLRKSGHEVCIFDAALFDRVTNEEWAERIIAFHPDYTGFSATTSAFLDAMDVCRKIKQRNEMIKTVFGGVHVSWGKDSILQVFTEIDFIITGEGESSFDRLVAGNKHDEIEGLYFRDGPSIKKGPDNTTLLELDLLPFPAYDLLEGFPGKYTMPLFSYPSHPGANVISSRGCIYKCSYCDRSVFGKSFRWNSPDYTAEQIAWLNKDFGVRHVNFYDDLFTLNRRRVEDLCTKLKSKNLDISYNCIVRIGYIDRNLVQLLKWSGCWMVSTGIESGDQAILDAHKEKLSLGMIRRDIHLLNNSGLWVKGLFMMGFPEETEESIVKTREFALSLPLKDANMTAFTPFPGAPISKVIHELGTLDNDWSKMDCVNFVFIPKGIRNKEILERHYGEFYRAFYNRFFARKAFMLMLLQSPHSYWRLMKNGMSFYRYARALKKK